MRMIDRGPYGPSFYFYNKDLWKQAAGIYRMCAPGIKGLPQGLFSNLKFSGRVREIF